MKTFEEQLLRLKQALSVSEDREVAVALGMSKAALSARKARDAFPADRLYALQAKRPDLKLDVTYVLSGATQQQVAQRFAAAALTDAPSAAKRLKASRPSVEEPAPMPLSGDDERLLTDLRRCAPGDQAAVRHLVSRLAGLER